MKPGVQANQVRETSPPNHASNPQQTNLKREFHISQATRDRANACKAYIESMNTTNASLIIIPQRSTLS